MIILLLLPFFTKITAEAPPDSTVFGYIEEHEEEYVQRLREWVSIESDSSNPEKRCKVVEMMNLTAKQLTQLGATVELVELGMQKLQNGNEIPLPPVILAEIRKHPKKPTVCFYGHLDVQSARYEDGWSTQPYTLEEKNVFNTEADLLQKGGTIPIGSQFYEVTQKNIMFLGIGGPDDAPHSQNEKLDRYNFIEETKLLAAFLEELASL